MAVTRAAAALCLAACVSSTGAAPPPVARPWLDATQPVAARVDALLAEMTLQEKVNQLLHVWTNVHDDDVRKRYGHTGVGAMYIQTISANTTCNADRSCRLAARNSLQRDIMASSRLGIPVTFVVESLHTAFDGQGSKPERPSAAAAPPLATIFPMPVGQGASWNRTLVRTVAAAVAVEARASGCDRGFSPELQVVVDPRFGRMEENFGGDPLLVAELGAEAVTGLGGGANGADTPNTYVPAGKLVSQGKHFAAYGFGDHDGAPADLSIPLLHDVFLKPWRAFVKNGGRGCMAAHNSVNNQPCHSSKWLLTNVFREQLGCTNCFVGTDFNDIANLFSAGTANATKYGAGFDRNTDPSIQALTAGIDQDLGGVAFAALEAAAAATPPLFDVAALDRAAASVLRTKFAAGLFDHTTVDPAGLAQVHSKEHVALAREAAAQALVLLQNPSGHLPLSLAATRSVALLGPNSGCFNGSTLCDVSRNMCGSYSPVVKAGQVATVADALAAQAGLTVRHLQGVAIDSDDTSGVAAAAAASAASDATVLVLGDNLNTCGESRDRMELDLPGMQLELLYAVLEANKKRAGGPKPVVAVLINCRAATFGEGRHSKFGPYNAMLADPNLSVLAAWIGGEQGGPPVVDALFGRAQPSGRLAQPFPKAAGYIHSWTTPWFHLRQEDYDWNGKPWPLVDGLTYDPIYCFGHGLSYNAINITGLSAAYNKAAQRFDVSVDVAVHGSYTGAPTAATVQVYFQQTSASLQVRNALNLAGFAKVWVGGPGDKTTAVVPVRVEDLGYTVWDGITGSHEYITQPGEYTLHACRSSCDCVLSKTVVLP